jgi:hypothetical protein
VSPAQSVFGLCAAHCTPVGLSLAGEWRSRVQREYANRETGRPGEGPYVERTDYTWEGVVIKPRLAEPLGPALAMMLQRGRSGSLLQEREQR